MKTYLNKNCKQNSINVKRKAEIIYALTIAEISQTQIAEELGISLQAVNNFISGRHLSARIAQWFKTNLKIEV